MASRKALAISDISEFKTWLMKNGWTIKKVKGEREIARATSKEYSQPFIAYVNNKSDLFATVPKRWYGIVHDFYASKVDEENDMAAQMESLYEKIESCITVVYNMQENMCRICPYTSSEDCRSCEWKNVARQMSELFTGGA